MGWPILLKQLRVDFRRNRFFISHFASLGVLGCWLIILIASETSDPNVTPTQIGQKVFNAFVWIQVSVVFVLFPLFSATAFTDERTNRSLDLLLITALQPSEIVWGKFLAAAGYCLMYILATVPLLAISFLFGGVHVSDVLLSYMALIGLTLLISMLGLCVSAAASSNVRATLTVYVILLVVGTVAWFAVIGDVWAALEENGGRTVVEAALDVTGSSGGNGPILVAVFALDVLAIFTCLFLLTTNRVRPSNDDHSSKLRLLTFLYLPLRLFLSLVAACEGAFDPNLAIPTEMLEESVRRTIVFAATLLLLVALVFPTEDANLSRRICDKIRGGRAWASYARLFAPGPFSGFLFAVLTAAIVCAGLFWVFELSYAPHLDVSFRHLVCQSLATLPIYLAAFASLGFLLCAASFVPLYSRLTVTFTWIITLLLPMIFYLGELPDRVYYFYFASPLVLWESLGRGTTELVTSVDDEIRYQLWGYPIISIAGVVFASVTFLNLAIGVWLAKAEGFSVWSYEPRMAKPLAEDFSEKSSRDDGDSAASDRMETGAGETGAGETGAGETGAGETGIVAPGGG